MTDTEFREGLDNRQARIVIAASDCVRHLRQQATGVFGEADTGKLLAFLTQTRFSPVLQRELVEAVNDLHDFETGSGKYKLTDTERLMKLEKLAQGKNPAPWVKEELSRLKGATQ